MEIPYKLSYPILISLVPLHIVKSRFDCKTRNPKDKDLTRLRKDGRRIAVTLSLDQALSEHCFGFHLFPSTDSRNFFACFMCNYFFISGS